MIERSHGKLRTRVLRPDRTPKEPAAAAAEPGRDPRTGRFAAGNAGGRYRQLKLLASAEAESLLRLPVEQVAPWLRPHLGEAQRHAQELVNALGPNPRVELVALCGDEAVARLFRRAAVTEGARASCSAAEARAWREEARAWLRESRQIVLTRKAVEREGHDGDHHDEQAELRKRQAAFQRGLDERQRTATTLPAMERTTVETTSGSSESPDAVTPPSRASNGHSTNGASA